jgi:hypothetical protein
MIALVKHQLALRLSEMTGVKPVAQVYVDDGESDNVCATRSRSLHVNTYDILLTPVRLRFMPGTQEYDSHNHQIFSVSFAPLRPLRDFKLSGIGN